MHTGVIINAYVIQDLLLSDTSVFAKECLLNIFVIVALTDPILNGTLESANVLMDIPSTELNACQIKTMVTIHQQIAP